MADYIPIIASVVFTLVFGMIYYHPKVAGSVWMKEAGVKMGGNRKGGMAKGIVAEIVAAAVLAYVLNMFITYAGATTVAAGATIGVLAWLGFIATSLVSSVAWEGKSVKLYALNNIYHLIKFAVIGAILVAL